MPLFGKKKDSKSEKQASGGYPTQPAYPTQSAHPTQASAQQYQASGQQYPNPYAAQQSGAPPPYSPYGQAPPGASHGQLPASQYSAPSAHQPAPIQPQTTYVVQGAYDAGARFGAGANPNVPPPPPGVAPNMAQMAATQGQNVVMTQNPDKFMTGGSDGGYVVW